MSRGDTRSLRRTWRIAAALYLLSAAPLPLFSVLDALVDLGPRGLAVAQDLGAELAFAWLVLVLPAYALVSFAWIKRPEAAAGGRAHEALVALGVGAVGLLLGSISVLAAL